MVGVAFHCARRERVFERETFRFGGYRHGYLFSLSVSDSASAAVIVRFGSVGLEPVVRKRSPTRIDVCFMLVSRFVKEPHPALWAQTEAIRLTNRLERQ